MISPVSPLEATKSPKRLDLSGQVESRWPIQSGDSPNNGQFGKPAAALGALSGLFGVTFTAIYQVRPHLSRPPGEALELPHTAHRHLPRYMSRRNGGDRVTPLRSRYLDLRVGPRLSGHGVREDLEGVQDLSPQSGQGIKGGPLKADRGFNVYLGAPKTTRRPPLEACVTGSSASWHQCRCQIARPSLQLPQGFGSGRSSRALGLQGHQRISTGPRPPGGLTLPKSPRRYGHPWSTSGG